MSDATATRLMVSPLSATNFPSPGQTNDIVTQHSYFEMFVPMSVTQSLFVWRVGLNVIKLTRSLTYLPMAHQDVSDGEIGPRKITVFFCHIAHRKPKKAKITLRSDSAFSHALTLVMIMVSKVSVEPLFAFTTMNQNRCVDNQWVVRRKNRLQF